MTRLLDYALMAGLNEVRCKFHTQTISMASPILTFRHEISNVETFIEMTLVGLTDDATSIHGAPEGNGANEALQER